MDRDTLLAVLENLSDCGGTADGRFLDSGGEGFEVSDVEEAIGELEAEVGQLRKVLAWVKAAPLAAVPATAGK